jgi:hypothetical protein
VSQSREPARLPALARLRDPREDQLRRGVTALKEGRKRQGEELIITVATVEATRLMREFRLEADDGGGEILVRWSRDNRGLRNLLAGARALRPVESTNVLLARLKTSLRSRAVEVWRSAYAQANPLAQFFWVRLGKALKVSTRLVERRGVVSLHAEPDVRMGSAESVSFHLLVPPTEPVMREMRYRLPRGADTGYERWMLDCIRDAGGKLKRRAMAELLVRAHGKDVRYPGQPRGEFEDDAMDADALGSLEDEAAWVNEEDEGRSDEK